MQTLSTSSLNSLDAVVLPEQCRIHGLNMAMYRLPGSGDTVRFMASDRLIESADVWESDGFLTATFLNDVRLIPADYCREINVNELIQGLTDNEEEQTPMPPMPAAYGDAVGEIVRRLRVRGGKTVYSATRRARCGYSVAEAFGVLCRRYPDAFVFVWQHIGSPEAWLGASPELLLKREGDEISTMALAGTRRAGSSGGWDAKNRDEQGMVADFIADILSRRGLDPGRGDTGTLRAGGVEHICTPFRTQLKPQTDVAELLRELAPTPALAGLPRDEALADIAALEPHRRSYYGGYFGPVSPQRMHLAVTLRCMAMRPDTGECTLYAGGGITASSEPQSEWREVNAKMQTLGTALGLEFTDRD